MRERKNKNRYQSPRNLSSKYPPFITTRSSSQSDRLQKIPSDELLVQPLSERSGTSLHQRAGVLERRDLALGTTLTTGDDGASVAHSSTGRRGDAGDEGDNRLVLGVVVLQELGGVLLSGPSDLTDHDDTVGLRVVEEDCERVDEVGACERISADTAYTVRGRDGEGRWMGGGWLPDDEGLAEADLGGLVHGFVGEGARAGDDADAPALVDEAGHDADLALAGSDDAGAVGTHETGLGLRLEDVDYADHVVLRDALGDADDERELGGDGLFDGAAGNGGRDKDRAAWDCKYPEKNSGFI